MWIQKKPDASTPPGATYAFNRAQVLLGCNVVGLGIAEDTLNAGEFVIYILLHNPITKESFYLSSWRDEELTGPGWMNIEEVRID